MSELSPASRELLAAAREQLGPDPAAVARMRNAIAATVGGTVVGASTGSVAAVASTTTTATAGSGALVTKLGIVSVLAVVAIGATVWAVRGDGESRASTAPALEVSRTVEQAPAAPSPTPAPAPVVTPTPVAAPVPSSPSPAMASAPVRSAKPARAPASVAPPAEADLAREVELIDQAMVALRQGKPGDALAAIRKHAVETRGHGQLAEDAAAIEIEASCRLHDPKVAAKLAAFDERYPTSVQRSRLSSQCK